MKKRLLSTLLALAMCLSLVPTTALAANTRTVNTAGELRDAVRNAGNGDTIKLGADIILSASDAQTVEDVCQFRYATQTTLKYDLVWQKLGLGWSDWNYIDEWGDELYTGRFWENFNQINVITGKQVRWLDEDGYTIHQAVGDTTDYEEVLDATCGLLVDGKSITLDLGGHTLKGDGGDKAPLYSLLFVRNEGRVTITGSGTMDGGGGTAVTAYGENTKVTINSGHFEGDTVAVASFNYAEVTITGGTFQGPNWTERRFSWRVEERRTGDNRPASSDDPYGSGSFQQWRPKIHEILQYDYTAYGGTLYTERNGKFLISGDPTLTAPDGGTLIYNQNSIGPEIVKIQGGIFEGSQIAVNGGRYLPTISGGTFTTIPDPLYMQDAESVAFGTADGKYTVKPQAEAAATITSGKAVAYFTELSAALANVKDSQTVTLLKDHSQPVTLSANSSYTLDLGGKTVSNSITASAGTVTVKNGTVNYTGSGNAIATSGSASLTVNCTVNAGNGTALYGGGGTLTANNGTYRGSLGGNLSLTGGKYSADPSNHLLEGCYAEKDGEWYSIKVGLSDDGYMEIKSDSDFQNFATRVNGGDTALNARLMVDIDLNNINWTPIASVDKPYTGTFDGNGHEIRNLNINVAATGMNQYVGLFAYVGTGGTIQNLEIATGEIVTDDVGSVIYIGMIAGRSDGKIVDCSNRASITVNTTRANYCGGIVGYADTVERCSNYGDCSVIMKSGTAFSWQHVGGVAGTVAKLIKDCYNTGKVSVSASEGVSNSTNYLYIGGICGDNYGSIDIVNCHNIGTVEAVNSDGKRNPSPISYLSSENSYYLDSLTASDNETATPKSETQFASGEVTYLLNGNKDAPEGPWYQNLTGPNADPYPVLDPTHAAVYKVGDQYVNLTCEQVAVNSQTLGYQKTLAALLNSLPKTANAFYEGSYAKQMPVTWDVNSCAYDPSTEEEQTFTVKGTVHVTGMINGGDKPIEMQVTVKAPRVNSFMTTAQPQLGYSDGGSLNLSGLRVVATMESGTTRVLEYDTEGVTFALDGQPIENGAALTKAEHNGKELKFIYDNKSTILGNLEVRSTNNAISQLTVNGIEVPYGNGGYAIALDPGSSLPSESDIQVTLGDATAQMTEKKQVDSGDREAQWEISVQAENGDVATYPLTVTVYENYKAINDQTLAEFQASWDALALNGITWNATQAQVQRTGDDAMGMSYQEQLVQWIITHLMEAGLAIPEGKGAPSVTFDGDITWATAGDRQDHDGTEGSFAFTLTYTANAGDDETQHSSFTSNSFTGAIIPTGYDAPNYTVNFNSQGGSAVSSIQVKEDTPIGDARPADPTQADHRFTGWYKEETCVTPWDFGEKVTADNMTLYAGWRWSQSHTEIDVERTGAANQDAFDAGEYGDGLRMGDTVTITASATLTEDPGETNTYLAEPETFTFYLGDPDSGGKLLDQVTATEEGGVYTADLEVDLTAGNSFDEGQNTVYAVFSGGDQLDGSRADTTLTVGKAMFTVTFDTDGGGEIGNQYVEDGGTARDPGDPVKADYRFTGWTADGRTFDFDDTITENTDLTANWEWAKSETGISFQVEQAGNPDAPIKTGVYHIGDDVSITATVKLAEQPDTSNTMNLLPELFAFYAGDPDNGGMLLGTVEAAADGEGGYTATLSNLELGTTEGLTGTGTYDIYAVFTGSNELNASREYTRLTVRPRLYTVTFDSDGGSAVNPQYVEEGALVERPTPPTLQDHRFTGWVDEQGAPYGFDEPVAGAMTLTATWAWSKSETGVSIQWKSAGNPDAGESGSLIRMGDTVTVTASVEEAAQSNSMFLSAPEFAFYVGAPNSGTPLGTVSAQQTETGYTASLDVTLTSAKGFSRADSYDIYAVFSGSGELDGSSDYATLDVAPAIYTVKFNSKEGTPVDTQYIVDGQTITEPEEPTQDGYNFGGWEQESGQPWNFDHDTVTRALTLTARWTRNPVFDIDGSVTDNDNKPLSNIQITLQRGKEIVFETVTNEQGQYKFEKVSPGLYNIVAERMVGLDGQQTKQTVTTLVEIIDADQTPPPIKMPPENVNSVLELPKDAPNIVVGGLTEEAIAVAGKSENQGATVTVNMAVEPKTPVTGTPDEGSEDAQLQQEQQAIQQQAASRTLDFLEIAVVKTVTYSENTTKEEIKETQNLLEIVVDFDFTNRENVTVYRYHDGQAQLLTLINSRTRAAQDGTYYLDRANDLIHIFTQQFSLYAIGYTVPTPGGNTGGGGGVSTYRITVEDSKHGEVKSSRASASRGSTVTLTVMPDEGYELSELIVTDSRGNEIDLTDKGDGKFTFTMPGRAVTVEAIFAEIEEEPQPWNNPFVDVRAGAWYYDAVRYVHEHGLMTGTSAKTFDPDVLTTRGMIVTILYRLVGCPDIENRIWGYPYADVDSTAYYGTAVYWARLSGIVAGYSSELFGPNDPITREQFAVMLYRFAGQPSVPDLTLTFSDADQVSGYASDAMRWAVGAGIISGKGNGILDPKGDATRAQAAAMLMRFCENAAK
jgi:uncharacterized repeat protein (TIGR02543 family)